MKLLVPRVKKACPAWNKRALTIEDVFKLAHKLKAKIHVIPLTTKGFYMRHKGKDHIYVDSRLSTTEFLFICMHELGHVILQVPKSITATRYYGKEDTKEEHEADMFAAVALIPLHILESMTPGEIQENYGHGETVIATRLKAHELYQL